MKENTCIKIDYNAFIKETNQLFDTTSEKKAKESGIFQEQKKYEPARIIVGQKFVIKGLDDSFVDKKVGDKYKIEIPPSQGFGKKEGKLIQLVPTKVFRKNEITPMIGMQVYIDNMPGIIRSTGSGRTLVDFNHPLAGKNLIYEVKILEEVKTPLEVIKTINEFFLGKNNVSVKLDKNSVEIKTKMEIAPQIKDLIKKMSKETLKKEYIFTFILE